MGKFGLGPWETFTKHLRKMSAVKLTTGLTGLKVAAHPHRTLGILYKRILKCLVQMPEDAAYRQYTEQVITQRKSVLDSEKDVSQVESKINGGQVEELIIQAENELKLARKMLEWKPWEPLVQEPPPNQWKWPM